MSEEILGFVKDFALRDLHDLRGLWRPKPQTGRVSEGSKRHRFRGASTLA